MEFGVVHLGLLLAAASPAVASCAYGTWLHPRAEGEVEIGTFGYIGPQVSLDPGRLLML